MDFGTGAPVVDAAGSGGKRRRTHVLRVVLSHSRAGYSETVDRQTTENFIRGIENAFRPDREADKDVERGPFRTNSP